MSDDSMLGIPWPALVNRSARPQPPTLTAGVAQPWRGATMALSIPKIIRSGGGGALRVWPCRRRCPLPRQHGESGLIPRPGAVAGPAM